MKNKLYSILAAWSVAALLAAPLKAQMPQKFTVKIPFEFVVGKRTLPAGEYTVVPSGLAIQLKQIGGKEIAWTLTSAQSRPMVTEGVRLAFHQYGETSFLYQIWRPSSNSGYKVQQSLMEQEMAKRTPGPQIEAVVAVRK